MLVGLIELVKAAFYPPDDPVHHCSVHKDIGCAHIDGILCDFPNCSIQKRYDSHKTSITSACTATDIT